jgi:hypothetical protein
LNAIQPAGVNHPSQPLRFSNLSNTFLALVVL